MKVPHIKQESETSCGAAALAMVYEYLGVKGQDEKTIWDRLKVKRPNIEGEYYLETQSMAKDGENFDLSYFLGQVVLSPKESALQPIKEFLALSIPVVVCQQISESNPLGHFRVVTGINSDGEIELNDPLNNSPELVSLERFMSLWQEADNDEVIGGQFFAVFKKEKVTKDCSFLVRGFVSSINSFSVSSLEFN